MSKFRYLRALFAADTAPVNHLERLVSAGGGLLGIALVYFISATFIPGGAGLIVASMGASAVLLFAVPHGQLSQPWALIGGHMVSAFIGVACYRLIPDPMAAAACAVGFSIGAMYYLRCLHPPGGATALTAVIGGHEVHAMGFMFVLTPVALNALVILAAAVAINYSFAWRRYPASLAPRPHVHPATAAGKGDGERELTHTDLEYALRKIGSFVDVTEEDLAEIYALATEHAHQAQLAPEEIKRGRYYSNGRYADEWAVRQIVDDAGRRERDKDLVIYKVIAGNGRRSSGVCTRAEFARWARYEVFRNENSWQKIQRETPSSPLPAIAPASAPGS